MKYPKPSAQGTASNITRLCVNIAAAITMKEGCLMIGYRYAYKSLIEGAADSTDVYSRVHLVGDHVYYYYSSFDMGVSYHNRLLHLKRHIFGPLQGIVRHQMIRSAIMMY